MDTGGRPELPCGLLAAGERRAAKPANEVTTDPEAGKPALAELSIPTESAVSASSAEPYREIIERALDRGRNAMGGCVATFKNQKESDWLGRPGSVSCSHPEQLVDELNLLPNSRKDTIRDSFEFVGC